MTEKKQQLIKGCYTKKNYAKIIKFLEECNIEDQTDMFSQEALKRDGEFKFLEYYMPIPDREFTVMESQVVEAITSSYDSYGEFDDKEFISKIAKLSK